MSNGFVEQLPCELTRDEKALKADEMAGALKHYGELELRAKASADEYRRELKRIRAIVDERAEEVRTGVEYRAVECAKRDRFRDNQIDVVRLDTGEVVRSERMSVEERQGKLSLADDDEDDPTATRQ
jgi:hypothetical protein